MTQVVEKGADVAVDHVLDPFLQQPLTKIVQRLMAAAAGAEAVGELAEILLVDRFQQLRHSLTDDLVLQGRQAEWPQLAIALRYPAAFDRLGGVRSIH